MLNVLPNDTVNQVMETQNFDDGAFWLLIEPPTVLVTLAALGLSLVAVFYFIILIKLVTVRRTVQQTYQVKQSTSRLDSITKKVEKVLDDAATKPQRGKVTSSAVKLAASLTHNDSKARKTVKLWLKAGELALETVLVYQMLESGSPAGLIAVFTMVVVANALTCAVMMFLPFKRAVLSEMLVDITFDLLVAIGFPMLVLFYCLSTFSLNRTLLAINLEVFPPGMFERAARVIADPVQTAVIDHSLKSLRVMSVLDFFTRTGVNLTLCFRLRRVIQLIEDPSKQRGSVYPKRHYPAAVFFVLFSIFLVVFVEESVRTSTIACDPHPECAMNARRWTILEDGSLTQCPCLMLIDRDVAPKSYAVWLQPNDVTEKVAQLASMGELQGVLLTNRYLPVLPEELRRCTNMKHLSLEYTHTQTFPAWVREYTKLEFLHIESKTFVPAIELPDGMLDDMSSLTFIHFAAFIPVARLPSFDGLTNLRSLTLAVFLIIEEFPSFDHLYNLERLVIACVPMLRSLPDFTAIKNLKAFAALDRGEWCCNGFLSDCDLQNPLCEPHQLWGSPAATCLPSNRTNHIATPATLEAVKNFPMSTCGPVLRPGDLDGPATLGRVNPCNGTLWKQCNEPGAPEAMCYNERLMVVACTSAILPIKMRRMQIAEGVGDVCDSEMEAWLGCK